MSYGNEEALLLWVFRGMSIVIAESPEREELPEEPWQPRPIISQESERPLSSQEEDELHPCSIAAELLGRFKSAKDDVDDHLLMMMEKVDEAKDLDEPVGTGWYVKVCDNLRDANHGAARMELAFRQIREHENGCLRARNYRKNIVLLRQLYKRNYELEHNLRKEEKKNLGRIKCLQMSLDEERSFSRAAEARLVSLRDEFDEKYKTQVGQQRRLLRVLARRNTALHIRLSIEKKIAKQRPGSQFCSSVSLPVL